MKILVLNTGSSSLKGLLSDVPKPLPTRPPEPLWGATVEWGRHPGQATCRVQSAKGETSQWQSTMDSFGAVMDAVLHTLREGPTQILRQGNEIDVVGHRIVHGGIAFRETTRITPEVRTEIARLA